MIYTKIKLFLLIVGSFACCLLACNKQDSETISNLYRKWKLIEIYDPFGSGVTHKWYKVMAKDGHGVEFTADGHYKKWNGLDSVIQCSGTYTINNQQKIYIASNCELQNEELSIISLTKDCLILSHQGTEWGILYKYLSN
jgi:hypothetical protein